MTVSNRIDATFDTLASVGKTVTNSYYNAFFSPEASERYEAAGVYIGNTVGETLKRFELDDHARTFLSRFQPDDNEAVEPEEVTDYMDEDE